ncbi:MAG: SagB/ThcOx family dehydrogenase [Candidatus Aminicenantaceae bacterium]
MKKNNLSFIPVFLPVFLIGVTLVLSGFADEGISENTVQGSESKIIQLPNPRYESKTSVEKALSTRRSIRNYAEEPLSTSDISQILWAAQGITKKRERLPTKWNTKYEWQGGLRTAPSAGALYPMEIYLIAGNVKGLSKAVYKYIPKNHSLKKVIDGDKRTEIYDVALKQGSIKEGAALIVMAGVYERSSFKYGERAQRYVHIEVGLIGENIYLQGITLGIGTVMIGAFKDEELKKVLGLPQDEHPLAIMPLGKIPTK